MSIQLRPNFRGLTLIVFARMSPLRLSCRPDMDFDGDQIIRRLVVNVGHLDLCVEDMERVRDIASARLVQATSRAVPFEASWSEYDQGLERDFHVHSATTGLRDTRLCNIISMQSHSKEWRIPSFREVSLEAGVERPIDLRVQLRAMESPAVLKRIHTDSAGHSSSINHMLWIDHIETVVTAGMDKTGSLEGHTCTVTALEVRLWNIGRKQCLQSFNSTFGLAKGVDDGPVDPRCLVVINRDLVALLLAMDKYPHRQVSFTLQVNICVFVSYYTQAIAINGRLGHVVTSTDRDITTWDIFTGKRLLVFPETTSSPIKAMCIEPLEERLIAIGTDTGSLAVHNYAVMAKVKTLRAHSSGITNITWLGHLIFSLCVERQLIIYDATNITDNKDQLGGVLKLLKAATRSLVLDLIPSSTAAIDCSLYGRQVVYGTDNGTISWYRIDSGKLEKSRPASQGGGPDALLTGLPIPNGICMVSLLNGTTPSGLQVSTTLTLSASGVVSLFGLLPMERFEPLVSWRFAWKSADSKVPMMVSVEDNVASSLIWSSKGHFLSGQLSRLLDHPSASVTIVDPLVSMLSSRAKVDRLMLRPSQGIHMDMVARETPWTEQQEEEGSTAPIGSLVAPVDDTRIVSCDTVDNIKKTKLSATARGPSVVVEDLLTKEGRPSKRGTQRFDETTVQAAGRLATALNTLNSM
ncbi:hypothetical protein Pmar_PMAR004872 [Perkinsus marinus ATCC 50983]|uniref:Uncharacterized protein n=1 Tax=Perkinsus marinus (strain ATCC 50983 / TXsc) TaxID=423536 RepID=C5LL91_PERM5|nr:hypothetical protein Pmar_PMAR004872 [Perkinsus marinus ATCC 50983]EER02508.1 hypothetical protein Pmar_PMAR004872 [Perkinsus marinus ATCC 50983]|eukprot:XP_002769790.1 hypothetical protein Pmar_PMAR004872 [Perkinsus marinus ATCC 50983]